MLKQGQFPGGINLAGHKQVTQLSETAIPPELIYPLLQRDNSYARPIVKPGQQVLKGEVIARPDDPLATPIHAASSGHIAAIAPRIIAHPSTLSDTCIIIATDGLDHACTSEPCLDYQLEPPASLRTKIAQAGIVGLGGAVFPTAIKLAQQSIHTLIINGAECEPYISCDASLILAHAREIVQGALILQYILQAQQCIIAVENNLPFIQQALRNASSQENIKIVAVPAIYPTGGEKQLIDVLLNIKIPAQQHPAQHGIICQNIGTAYASYQAIVRGLTLTERIITLTGAGIKQAKNIRAKIGTPIKHLIEQCGGYQHNVHRLIMGGSMMGMALSTDEIAVTKASNCILALSTNELALAPTAMPCIRCGDCAKVCPVELLPQQLYWYGQSRQFEQSQNYHLFDCIECGCCDIVCPSHIPLVQNFRAAKSEIIIKEQMAARANLAKRRFQNQQQRKEKQAQEKQLKAAKRQAAIDKMKAAAAQRKAKV